jgi:hypothetical protein
MLNKLMAADKENKSVEGAVLFSSILAAELGPDSIESFVSCNRGCFILVSENSFYPIKNSTIMTQNFQKILGQVYKGG